jgi:hypothetical protein
MVSERLPPPLCDVLFVYGSWSPEAQFSQAIASPRNPIKAAHAYIAVFASENDPNAYIEHIGKRTDCSANIVMVLKRRDDNFAAFIHNLFAAMFEGQTMTMAWVRLAPQQPTSPEHAALPSTIFAAEAGHVAFHR